MARPRKFKTAKALSGAWEQYKAWCNDQEVLTHDFSSKNSEFVSAKLKRSVTYTIEGFCAWAGISRAAFYERYAGNEIFADIVTRMREECEVDARMKFELGVIDTKLAPLWMSRHGYSTKQESTQAAARQQDDDPITRSLKEAADALRKTDADPPLAL
ncbi:MAG: DNA-packaging protein [Oscillospiraceae bacterium]|nr:DNA-packaging protein [Oscillospiraceae bacterium]